MVKFLKVTMKKFKPEIIGGELVGHNLDSMIHRQEDLVNQWLIKGFEIVSVSSLEDLTGYHLLFVLYKKPSQQARGDSK